MPVVLSLLARAALAAGCGDLDALELRAARSALDADVERCLEASLDAASAEERARASFVLILSAYASGDVEAYGERMQRHLTRFHTTDPEVAYLYARYLWKKSGETAQPPWGAEILKWSRVAMDGRTRWTHNRRNYDEMVRNLYDMLVQSSMQQALVAQRAYAADPSDTSRLAADDAQRRARHWLIVAAPCLHRGECGPTFEVVVEGLRECDDLDVMGRYAASGRLDDGHRSCLRARYRRPGAPRGRILEVLVTDAEGQADPERFEYLLAWHWNVTDQDDPEMAYRFARWLVANAGDRALLAQWSEAALHADARLRGERKTELMRWRAEGWEGVLAQADAKHRAEGTERTRRELDVAKNRAGEARAALETWCRDAGCAP